MKFQIVLVLAIAACAFADEVTEEPTLAIDDVKVEANDDDQIKVENDHAESKDEPVNEKPDEEQVSSDDQKDGSDIKSPIIFEWTSVYRNHDIDVAVPVGIEWPSNVVDFLNALHGEGLKMVPENDDYDIHLAFPTVL
ncbi:uncharacterized protein LOC119189762 [Manduca sexta]|uniref:uncharacterized protein LOC119189762 n=1 Tax=Manduca sexta TaxID=7130 RepID=UPI00188F966A|nr:uncharacterized protein LOC119189762 [Manduca sexta]